MLKVGILFTIQSRFFIENDQVKENEMGRAHSMHGKGEEERTNTYRI
jgi:hypothetical protein